jgi:hypothetical protein
MNRILIDLRNRLTTEHLEQLMKISIEGPSDLDNDLKDLIIDYWKSKKYEEFRFNLDLFFFSKCFVFLSMFFSLCISNRRKSVIVL